MQTQSYNGTFVAAFKSMSHYRPAKELFLIYLGVLGVIAFAFLAFTVRYIIIASFIAVGIGVLCSPLVKTMKNRFKIPKGVSAVFLFIFVFLFIVSLIGALGYLVSDQVKSLVEHAPQLFSKAESTVDSTFSKYPWIYDQIKKFNISATVEIALGYLYQGIQLGAFALGSAVIVLILGIYIAINSREYFAGFLSLFPAYQRQQVSNILQSCGWVIRKWLKCQLIVMAIMGSVTTLGLWIIGIDYWLVFGLLTGLLGIIPYVGIILTVIATCLVTLGSEPDKVPWVLALFIVSQQLEGNFLLPIVMKEGVQLPEVHLMVLMLILGSWFGLLGVFIAPPLLAVARTIYQSTYLPYMNRKTSPYSQRE